MTRTIARLPFCSAPLRLAFSSFSGLLWRYPFEGYVISANRSPSFRDQCCTYIRSPLHTQPLVTTTLTTTTTTTPQTQTHPFTWIYISNMSSALHNLKDKLSGSKEGEQQVGIQPHPAVRLFPSIYPAFAIYPPSCSIANHISYWYHC